MFFIFKITLRKDIHFLKKAQFLFHVIPLNKVLIAIFVESSRRNFIMKQWWWGTDI